MSVGTYYYVFIFNQNNIRIINKIKNNWTGENTREPMHNLNTFYQLIAYIMYQTQNWIQIGPERRLGVGKFISNK